MNRFQIIIWVFQFLQLYQWLMVIFVIASWFPDARNTGPIRFIGKLVQPYFQAFRMIIPPLGGIDISVLVAFFVYRYVMSGIIMFLQHILIR